jgi:hypothetical protein
MRLGRVCFYRFHVESLLIYVFLGYILYVKRVSPVVWLVFFSLWALLSNKNGSERYHDENSRMDIRVQGSKDTKSSRFSRMCFF